MGREGKHAAKNKGKPRDGLIRTLDDVDEIDDGADDGVIVMDRGFHFDDDHDPLINLQGWKPSRALSSDDESSDEEAEAAGSLGKRSRPVMSDSEEESDEEASSGDEMEASHDASMEEDSDEDSGTLHDDDQPPVEDEAVEEEEDDDADVDEDKEGEDRTFSDLRLSRPLLKSCKELGFTKPTPIQRRCIPFALAGKDVCGSAHTGSGKTAAFMLPVLEKLLYRSKRIPQIRVLVLTPTRELAAQCHEMTERLSQFTDIRTCLVVGGLSNKAQETALRSRPDIVVATPGRMIDHLRNAQSITLESVEVLILDEADRLLDMGFAEEVREIVKGCPKGRQTLLFSATMNKKVMKLASISLREPTYIAVNRQLTVATGLRQEFVRVKESAEGDREAMLVALCSKTYRNQAIIFVRSKRYAHHLKLVFGLMDLKAAELHGNLSQTARLEALEDFRDRRVGFLIATDLASRGLDIQGIQTVINFTMPRSHAQYIHRVGRTARAGKGGCACSFVSEDDRPLLKEIIEKAAGGQVTQRKIPPSLVTPMREQIDGLKGDIERIMEGERDQSAIDRAERDMTKLQNLVDHKQEIQNRPKRTWFQSERERKDSQARSKVAIFGEEDKDEDVQGLDAEEPDEYLSKRQFQRKLRKDMDKKYLERRGERRKKKRQELVERSSAPEIQRSIRSVKSANRPKKLNATMGHGKQGSRSGEPPKKKKKSNVFAASSKGASQKGPKNEFSASKSAFKSKRRYKRR